jgi:AcrR family transcriptional regulator
MASNARERMVDSALELFRQHGYNGTSLRDVVAHSGGPWGSLHHYFPEGKAQLGVEAVEVAGDAIEAVFRQSTNEGGDFVEAFEWTWSWWTGYVVGDDFVAGCPVAGVALEAHTNSPRLAIAADRVFERWQSFVATGLQISGLDQDEAKDLAALIIAAQEGATLMARAARSPEPLERAGASLTRLMRDRLAKAKQPAAG